LILAKTSALFEKGVIYNIFQNSEPTYYRDNINQWR